VIPFRARDVRHDGGQALLEFGLSVPVFLAVVYGICDFGRALYTYDLVTSAARVGSRYAIVHGSSCAIAGCPVSAAAIQTYVQSKVNGVNASQLSVATTWSTAPGCTDPAFKGPQCRVTVTVSYPFAFYLALNQTIPMTSSSQMVISQ
jgi:Flp pilus assembly protein TadG